MSSNLEMQQSHEWKQVTDVEGGSGGVHAGIYGLRFRLQRLLQGLWPIIYSVWMSSGVVRLPCDILNEATIFEFI